MPSRFPGASTRARELEFESSSHELKLLRTARFDANAPVEIMGSRELRVRSFLLAGLPPPLGATIWRLMSGAGLLALALAT